MTAVAVFPVPKEAVPRIWPQVAPLLAPAIETVPGKYALTDLLHEILTDVHLLWVAVEGEEVLAAITTRIVPYPRGRALSMDWIGGKKMVRWLPVAHPLIVAHAKAHGCSHLEGFGRKGWERWLARYDWRPEYTAYRMDLNDGQQG